MFGGLLPEPTNNEKTGNPPVDWQFEAEKVRKILSY
jgi:hypothetical protein